MGNSALPGQALYLKYRPHVFDDMIGQEHITRSLRNALAQDRVRHAYLFSGPRGTGKTTLARILAKAVNCQYPDPMYRPCDQCEACVAVNEGRYLDLIEIDAASNNGVDDVRELRDKIGFSPNEGRYKVYVIDEVHRFSGAALMRCSKRWKNRLITRFSFWQPLNSIKSRRRSNRAASNSSFGAYRLPKSQRDWRSSPN